MDASAVLEHRFRLMAEASAGDAPSIDVIEFAIVS
jgi:hypothetical protein